MHWIAVLSRIALLVLVGAGIGWLYDRTLLGVSLALVGLATFWTYQTWRLQSWLQDSSEPAPDLYGVWGSIASHISRQQREAGDNEERLQTMVDYLLQSFASMRDGVVILEQGGGIKWCNEAATRLLGLNYPEDTGQAVTNLVRHPAFIEYFTAERYDEPLKFYTGDKSKLHLQLTITRFADGDRLVFVRDITTLVRQEQIRRDFVGNVSHELRTPLTVITGYLGTFMAANPGPPERWRRPLAQMAQQAERMENLLKDLLWLSRIESDEREDKRELVNVAALLEELRDEQRALRSERRLKLEIECHHRVNGDYRELYSAVGNLVQNAFKYSADESLVTLRWSHEGDACRLSVIDEGIGIDPVHFDRLTERFYRVDDSRSSATGGTGLGLAIVKHVAVSHDAALQIESKPGAGSVFSLEFKSAAPPPAQARPAAQ